VGGLLKGRRARFTSFCPPFQTQPVSLAVPVALPSPVARGILGYLFGHEGGKVASCAVNFTTCRVNPDCELVAHTSAQTLPRGRSYPAVPIASVFQGPRW
jgi:hypothetical protein